MVEIRCNLRLIVKRLLVISGTKSTQCDFAASACLLRSLISLRKNSFALSYFITQE